MGRMLGAHDPDAAIDRPDLNQCPDCECFFQQLNCPLCGKVCPEEMRAGNRKPVRIKKKRNSGTGRVTFIEWYHSWWFILLMMLVMPIIGICLLATSPHKKWAKITFVSIAVAYLAASTVGIGTIVSKVTGIWDKPVDTSLTREEYIAACETVSAQEFYRLAESYTDKFVCVTLTVEKKIADSDAYYNNEDYFTYYLCRGEDGADYMILIRDCIQDGSKNFVPGDNITVYGEGAGNVSIYDMEYLPHSAPCIHVAYVQ